MCWLCDARRRDYEICSNANELASEQFESLHVLWEDGSNVPLFVDDSFAPMDDVSEEALEPVAEGSVGYEEETSELFSARKIAES